MFSFCASCVAGNASLTLFVALPTSFPPQYQTKYNYHCWEFWEPVLRQGQIHLSEPLCTYSTMPCNTNMALIKSNYNCLLFMFPLIGTVHKSMPVLFFLFSPMYLFSYYTINSIQYLPDIFLPCHRHIKLKMSKTQLLKFSPKSSWKCVSIWAVTSIYL